MQKLFGRRREIISRPVWILPMPRLRYRRSLCSLKERGKYNLEIAEELKLTPATASHHMGILLCNHFVTVEKRDGKVYYQFNQEAFGEMIRLLEEIFL